MAERKLICSQCGQPWGAWACGPTHALFAETDNRDLVEAYSQGYKAGTAAGKIDGIMQAASFCDQDDECMGDEIRALLARDAAAEGKA